MSYEHVKRFRKKIKTALVKSFGEKCVICGFNKFVEALEFHHKNPLEKDFSISGWRKLNTQILKEESKKCVLVCSNCHHGLHNNHITLPYILVDPDFTIFDSIVKKEEIKTSPCLKCGKLKPLRFKYCSQSCAWKGSQKVLWDSIDLKKELETKCINKIATELGLSFNAVKKRIIKLGI